MRKLGAIGVLSLLACLAFAGPAGAGKGSKWRFPLEGEHSYGNLSDTGFGKKRSDGSHHTGQDVIADCGIPLVAPHLSRVRDKGYDDDTGFFLVLDGKGTKLDFVFAHMKGKARVKKGARVKAGRRVGSVGRTGSASGICHLHFELWSGAWFSGGRRVDPLPRLRKWDRRSGGPEVEKLAAPARFPTASD